MGNENSALIGQRPQWQLDDDATQCNGCKATFGIFVRRHHCRQCGYIFCDRCCSRTVALPALGYMSPQRVCMPCLQKTIEAEPRAFQKLSPQSRRSLQQRTKSGSFGQKDTPARHSMPQQLPGKTGPGSASGSQGASQPKSANVPLQLPGRPNNAAASGTMRRENSASAAGSLAKPPVLTSTVSSRGSCISPQPERARTPSTSNFSAPKAGTPLNLSLSFVARGNFSFTSAGELDLTGWDPNHVAGSPYRTSSPTSNSLTDGAYTDPKTLATRTRSLTETSHCSRESGAQAAGTPQPTLESPTPVPSSPGDRRMTPRCPSEDELDKIYNKFLEKPHSTQTRKYMADSFNQFHVPLPDSLAKSGPF